MTAPTRPARGLALALLLAVTPAMGAMAAGNEGTGETGTTGDQAGSASSNEPVTEADLGKFAAAYGELQSVRAEYGQKMQQAEDQSKQQKLRKEGQQAMISAIRDEGLEIAEYNRIGKQLNDDKELRSKLQGMMQEQNGGDGSGSSDNSG